jgi:hypothetical protein
VRQLDALPTFAECGTAIWLNPDRVPGKGGRAKDIGTFVEGLRRNLESTESAGRRMQLSSMVGARI